MGAGQDFHAVSKALKAAGEKELRRELHKGLRDAAKPLIKDTRAAARTDLPRRGGLAARMAKAPQRVAVLTGREPAVRIVMPKKQPGYADGVIRRPVFGRKGKWVTQRIDGDWFDGTLSRGARRVVPEMDAAVERVLRKIAKKGELMQTKLAFDLIADTSKASGPMKALGKDVEDTGSKVDGLGEKFASFGKAGLAGIGLAVGAGFGVAMVKGFSGALEAESSNDKLAAQLGINNPEYAAELGKIAGDLYANAYGESLGAVNDALRHVLESGVVYEDAASETIEGVTAKVLDLATAFDTDLAAVTRGAGALIRNGLAKDADEAFDIITRGFQQGVDKSEDYLDTLNEYSPLFSRLGLDGVEATGLLRQGLQGGARDADTVADALKEFQIRATDGSEASSDAFKTLGIDAKDATAKIARGGEDARRGLGEVLDKLRDTEDPVKRNAAAVGLFGTKAEDLGTALFELDTDRAAKGLGEIGGAAERMGDILNDNTAVKIETFKRKAEVALTNFFGEEVIPLIETKLVPALESIGRYFSENKEEIRNDALTVGQILLGVGQAGAEMAAVILDGLAFTVTGMNEIAQFAYRWARDIVTTFEAAVGWGPGYGDAFDEAKAVLDAYAFVTDVKTREVSESLHGAADTARVAADAMAGLRDRISEIKSKAITVTVDYQQVGSITGVPYQERAGGGRVNPGELYLVGEREPEFFVPDRPGQILNQRQAADAGITGGGGLHIHGDYVVQNAAQEPERIAGPRSLRNLAWTMGWA